jgi:caffeoyl-CoA O-methyltransferase
MENVVDEAIEEYARRHSSPEPAHLAALAEETRASTRAPQMMVGVLEGGFLAMLVHMLRPRLVLEIGTFTGYSALSMAAALPPGGRIVTCEIDDTHAAIARRHIAASSFADRIELRFGPAADAIAALDGPFDFVFVDADKTGYLGYYEAVLPKLSEHGVIAVDNVLWNRRVLEPPGGHDDDTRALVAFNEHVAGDERVECVMLTVRDGVTLIRRRRA